MDEEKQHITSYSDYAKLVIIMLILTAVNIGIATFVHSGLTVVAIMFVACVQAYIALNWFMHLRFDNKILRYFVYGVFALYAVVIIITFIDYIYR